MKADKARKITNKINNPDFDLILKKIEDVANNGHYIKEKK